MSICYPTDIRFEASLMSHDQVAKKYKLDDILYSRQLEYNEENSRIELIMLFDRAIHEYTKHNHHPVMNVNDGLFNTVTGAIMNLKEPDYSKISIDDIAIGLANNVRFAGQTLEPYSIAQHCVLVAHLAPLEIKLEALMHDSSEAYIHDIQKPLKIIINDLYEPIETKWMKAIFKKYNLNYESLSAIKPFDMDMLQIEFDFLKGFNRTPFYELLESAGFETHKPVWNYMDARDIFYQTFQGLTSMR